MIIFDIETTGLNPLQEKVLTMQIKHAEKIIVWKLWEEKNDEVKLIQNFIDYIKNLNETIVGYNISRFDINFLLARLLVNKKLTDNILKIFAGKKWIDLTEFQKNNHGMDNWLKELKIPRQSNVTGWHVPSLYELGMYNKIEEHAIDDLFVCEQVVKKMNLKF